MRRAAHPSKLTRAKEFQAVLAQGVRMSGKRFLLRALPNSVGAARLGTITGRKAAKRAVDRNRAKRLLREAFRAARQELPAWDVVVQLRNDLRDVGNDQIRTDLARLLQEVRIRASRAH